MTRLDTVPVEELEDAYHEATGKRATERLLVAIIYKRGPSVPMIADAQLPEDMADGTDVTLDADRGIVYDAAVQEGDLERH